MDNNQISVTHFVNPQFFWFHLVNNRSDPFAKILQIEESLMALYQMKKRPQNFTLSINDKVTTYYLPWNKFIRGSIMDETTCRPGDSEYIVWAIDYGFPFLTKREHIYALPKTDDHRYTQHIENVRCGGIYGIYPAMDETDFEEMQLKFVRQEHWHHRACDILEKTIRDADIVMFHQKYHSKTGQRWGDLKIVTRKGNKILASEYLIQLNLAMVAGPDFRTECLSLSSIRVKPWLSSSGKPKYLLNNSYHAVMAFNATNAGNHLKMRAADLNHPLENWFDDVGSTDTPEGVVISFKEPMLQVSDVGDNEPRLFDAGIRTLSKYLENSHTRFPKSSTASLQASIAGYEDHKAASAVPAHDQLTCEKRSLKMIADNYYQTAEYKALKTPPVDVGRPPSPTPSDAESVLSTSTIVSCLSTISGKSSRIRKHLLTRQLLEEEYKTHKQSNRSAIPYTILETDVEPSTRSCSSTNSSDIRHLHKARVPEDFKPVRKLPSTSHFLLHQSMKRTDHREKTCGTSKPDDPYAGLKIIPAGYDLRNLMKFKDEKHNWHTAPTTINRVVPHDPETLKSVPAADILDPAAIVKSEPKPAEAAAEQQMMSSNTRSNLSSCSDEYKSAVSTMDSVTSPVRLTASKHGYDIQQSPKNSNVDINKATENKLPAVKHYDVRMVTSDKKNKSPNERIASMPTVGSTYRSRRQLQSPALQKEKLDDIIRVANFKRILGSEDIVHLPTTTKATTAGGALKSDGTGFGEVDGDDENGDHFHSSITDALVDQRKKLHEQRKEKESTPNLKNNDYDGVLRNVQGRLAFELGIDDDSDMCSKTGELLNVENEPEMRTRFIDHLVLAHGRGPLKSIESLSQIMFPDCVIGAMRHMGLTNIYRTQAYAWPHMLRLNSLFLIGAGKTGRTFNYMPPLCSVLFYRNENGGEEKTFGPSAIILVSSADRAESVHMHCQRLLHFRCNDIKVVAFYGMRNCEKGKLAMLDSCGILVTTPASMLRLLDDSKNEKLIDPKKLKHIIFDDMDLMLARSPEDFLAAMKGLFRLCQRTEDNTLSQQIVAVSRTWNTDMAALIRRSRNPLLVIGDFLEAAIYGKARLQFVFSVKDEKIDKLLDFMAKHPPTKERLIVICNSGAEVTKVVKSLSAEGVHCLSYGEEALTQDRNDVEEWKQASVCSKLLVCSDSTFPELEVQNAINLVHFSLPTTWTKFTSRFAAIAKSYPNYIESGFDLGSAHDPENPWASSMVLLDEDNTAQLPRLVDFARRHNQLHCIPAKVLEVSEAREKARNSSRRQMCPYVLEFGECDESRCEYRHKFGAQDVVENANDLPTKGELQIVVLKAFTPTHYAARLLKHRSHNSKIWRCIRSSDKMTSFSMRLNRHYQNRDNLILHWPLAVGDLCIYKTDTTFQRASIIGVPSLQHADVVQLVHVSIKLIDLGVVLTKVKSDHLFLCDEMFRDFPPQAVSIRLFGIVPFHNERCWDSDGSKSVEKWIKTDVTVNQEVHVNINFTLAETIWVNNVIVLEHLPTLGGRRYVTNLKRLLLEQSYGVKAHNDRMNVRRLAEECGLLSNNMEHDVTADGNETPETFVELEQQSISTERANEQANKNPKKLATIESVKSVPCEGGKANADAEKEENWDECLKMKRDDEVFVPLGTPLEIEIQPARSQTQPQTQPPKQPQSETLSRFKHQRNGPEREEWTTLPLHTLAQVEIGDEGENGHWTNIFLQPTDDVSQQLFNDLLALIERHIAQEKQKPMSQPFDQSWFKPFRNCVVKYDDRYLRAKLISIFGEHEDNFIYRFFLCDYACFVIVTADKLYDDFLYPSSEEIINFTPYQAIHCTLVGVKLDRFARHHKVTKDYLYAYPVIEYINERCPSAGNLSLNSYKILLYECEEEGKLDGMSMVNLALLDLGTAIVDEETKHFLELSLDLSALGDSLLDDTIPSVDSAEGDGRLSANSGVANFDNLLLSIQKSMELSEDEEDEEGGDSDDSENFKECENDDIRDGRIKLKENIRSVKEMCSIALEKYRWEQQQPTYKEKQKPIMETEEKFPSFRGKTEKKEKIPTAFKRESEVIDDESKDGAHPVINRLKVLNKRLPTTWYDNDFLIYLVIHAPDISEYYLNVTTSQVIFATRIENEDRVLIMNLMLMVDPRLVTHEIRGVNVVVRLVKTSFTRWPRLLEQSDKFPWLQYELNALKINELEELLPQQKLQLALEHCRSRDRNRHDSDSDDSECDMYQTFTPIVNKDDLLDPTMDILDASDMAGRV